MRGNIVFVLTIIIIIATMGFLSNIFSRSKEKEEHNEDWAFYFSNVNDKLSSICLDLGFSLIASLKGKPNVLWISIQLNNPREDGLSSDEEFERLNEVEDFLIEKLKNNNVTYVGRITSDGYREFFYYTTNNNGTEKIIKGITVQLADYKVDYGFKYDETWDTYFNLLYPNPKEMQMLQNGKVLDNLVKNGDDLTKAREVFHWVFFKDELSRMKYVNEVETKGFRVIGKSYEKEEDRPYILEISRIDLVDWDSVNEYVLYLWELANELEAEYDGWETSVEK